MQIINQQPIYTLKNVNQASFLSQQKHVSVPQRTINNSNINNLNYANKSLISFKSSGYYKTLNENYFNLPVDKRTGKPFTPDIYQKAAAENLYKGNDVIVTAPTGTGKTAIAHYIISKNLEEGKKTFYTTPLKALSNDKVREFQKIYGEENIGLITGDKKINKDAPILIMTTEVYRNMVVKDNYKEANPILDDLKTVVFDELHYLGDTDRGGVWEQAIMFTDPKVQILSLSGTMANPEKITDWMASTKGHKYAEKITPKDGYRANDKGVHTVLINVPSKNRHVPLEYSVVMVDGHRAKGGGGGSKADRARAKKQARQLALSDSAQPAKHSYSFMVSKLKEEDKLPAIFFVFSKKEGKAILRHLTDYGEKLTTDKETRQIERTIREFKDRGKYLGESIDYKALKNGYAIHNAGMLPEQKELVEELFQKKLIKVVISTETLSAGINMPARSTVISNLRKPTETPDGDDHKRYINPNEFHQMAGRAGRRGIDTKGYCYSMATNKSQRGKFDLLIKVPSNDIKSHFNLDYSFVATAGDAYRNKDSKKLSEIFSRSLYAYDENPDIKAKKTKEMVSEFKTKEQILKDYKYLTNDNRLTTKGELLTQLNGYEQIPIIDSITSGELFGLDPIQLAGYVAGLANLEHTPQTDIPNKKEENFFIKDGMIDDLVYDFDSKVYEYNNDIYLPQGQVLKQNKNAITHVYEWADLNSENDDSTQNWKELYSGDMKKTIRDEGTLFREIMMTVDLLKQMDEIAQYGAQLSEKEKDKKYYNYLSDTIKASIELINREPANSTN